MRHSEYCKRCRVPLEEWECGGVCEGCDTMDDRVEQVRNILAIELGRILNGVTVEPPERDDAHVDIEYRGRLLRVKIEDHGNGR